MNEKIKSSDSEGISAVNLDINKYILATQLYGHNHLGIAFYYTDPSYYQYEIIARGNQRISQRRK